MILPADLAKLALQGKKSAACFSRTRRKCLFQPGYDYALQAGDYLDLRPKTLSERITIEAVRATTVSELDLRDVRKLGFRTRTDFYERWHGSDDVWLISFVLGVHTDRPRIPAAKFGANGDYTTTASQSLHGSSEEVPEGAQKRFALEGQANLALSRQIPRERLIQAVKEILPPPRNAKDRKQMRSIEHETRRYQIDRATETC